MAPQNSTFLSDDDSLPSEISRLSPIPKRMSDEFGGSSCQVNDEPYYEDEFEIPIWVCGSPRWISGIRATTTCTDIIQALVDDEVSAKKSSDSGSRDIQDYVIDIQKYTITERWRNCEQKLEGNTKLYELWLAWGCMKNEVQFRLKINRGDRATSNVRKDGKKRKISKDSSKIGSINKLIKNIIGQGETIKERLLQINDNQDFKDPEEFLLPEREYQPTDASMNSLDKLTDNTSEDELFLLIDNRDSKCTSKSDDSDENQLGRIQSSSLLEKLDSCSFDTLNKELYSKLNEMTQLLHHEKSLIHQIKAKNARYKTENNLYNLKFLSKNVELEVDDIQKRLQDFANGIIRDEQNLFATKVKIGKCSAEMKSLKHLIKEQETVKSSSKQQFQFVTRIVEFSNKNETMIV